MKGGRYLEALAAAQVIVFDKTGTLTSGEPAVPAIRPAGDATAETLLRTAASAELRSEHPVGQAIVASARSRGLTLTQPETFSYRPGRDTHVLGTIRVADTVRPEATGAIAELRRLGLRTVFLTGTRLGGPFGVSRVLL